MKERRSSKRWHTSGYSGDKQSRNLNFSVYNRANDEFLGYLLDISSEGMMITGRGVINEGEVIRMRIELPAEIRGSDQLMVEARSVWCERDTNPEYNRIGFSFTFTFPHHAEIIELLFEGGEEGSVDRHSGQPRETSRNP